ncbi:MAG: MBL fold metallo-hydrolase [Chloroflexia bacterium]|nr:MBL fold metallo-hydrolase [Chloroflexia bacterium]
MQLSFLGGADEVGASALLVEIAGRRVLIDAGVRPSPKARYGLTGDQLPDLAQVDRAGELDAVMVTHAHLDHSGCLELVCERYACPVYATPATMALIQVLHLDSRKIMSNRLEEEDELPLFDDVAVERLMNSLVPAHFHARLLVADGLAATFYPAGHIAGAAMVYLESAEGSLLVSGDVSVSPQRTVAGLTPPRLRPDAIVLESTYGGRLHANRAAEERRLVDTVAAVLERGGKVLIPAFALGRAQEVLLTLEAFRQRGELPEVPVWADGMVRAICGVYQQFPDALSPAFQEREGGFFGEWIHPVLHAGQREELVRSEGPWIMVSSSGMLAGGPSVFYARHLAGRPENAILLTGYQDEEAPGRRLQEMAERGQGTLRLGPDKVEVQCQLGTYSLSAHADEGQLLGLVEALDVPRVVLVHGEESARESLAGSLQERGRIVMQPRLGQTVEIRVAPSVSFRRADNLGQGRPLDLQHLWQAVGDPGGGTFTLEELARAWWGDPERAKEVAAALLEDDLYFTMLGEREGRCRARTRPQVELGRQRRQRLDELPDLFGRLVILRDEEGRLHAGCAAGKARDHVMIAGEPARCWPEDLLEILQDCVGENDARTVERLASELDAAELLPANLPPRPLEEIVAAQRLPGPPRLQPAAVALCLLRAGAQRSPEGYVRIEERMEPNQALAHAQSLFPPEARLRKCGYYADEGVLQLVFDFPDIIEERYGPLLKQIEGIGWEPQIKPEANQLALGLMVQECLPPAWTVVKGPSIYREQRQVAVTVAGEGGAEAEELWDAARVYRESTGFDLLVERAAGPAPAVPAVESTGEGPWEINAAYVELRRELAGSTLYKTSLKGGRIMLSFITPQVGERYRDQLQELSQRIGWPLDVNSNPNQVGLAAEARALASSEGATIVKGPSIHVSRGEVVVRLEPAPDPDRRAEIESAFREKTGYRLAIE